MSSQKGKKISSAHDGKLRIEWQNNRILFQGDGTFNKLLIGPRNDGTLAVELAQAGHDVLTAADENLIFSSRFNSFKIVATGTEDFPSTPAATPGSQSSESVDIATGVVSEVPLICLVFIYGEETTDLMLPSFSTIPSSGYGGMIAFMWQPTPYLYIPDSTIHITVESTNFVGGILPAVGLRWYVLRETAST